MEICILNPSFEEIGIIDVFNSFIWTTRYYESGDFELYMPVTAEALSLLSIGNYVTRSDDENTMIIEKIEIKTDTENGNFIIATGRDLKSILDRRVISSQQSLSGTVESAAYKLINHCCGNTALAARVFPNFTTAELKGYTETISAQVTGEVLYNYIIELCKMCGYGWKINRDGDALTCEIFAGEILTDVIFSPEFDNLINSDYIVNAESYKNVAYTAGEGEGTARIIVSVGEKLTGLERREVFIDARDVSSNDGAVISSDYILLLQQRGREKLAESLITEDFTGSIKTDLYAYKQNYNIGDIVTVENEYKITAASRIIEIVESWSAANGYTVIPTFEKWEVTA